MRRDLRSHNLEAAYAGGRHACWDSTTQENIGDGRRGGKNKKKRQSYWIDFTLLRYFNASFHPRAHTKAIANAVITARVKKRVMQVGAG